jgi:hypothetical protein
VVVVVCLCVCVWGGGAVGAGLISSALHRRPFRHGMPGRLLCPPRLLCLARCGLRAKPATLRQHLPAPPAHAPPPPCSSPPPPFLARPAAAERHHDCGRASHASLGPRHPWAAAAAPRRRRGRVGVWDERGQRAQRAVWAPGRPWIPVPLPVSLPGGIRWRRRRRRPWRPGRGQPAHRRRPHSLRRALEGAGPGCSFAGRCKFSTARAGPIPCVTHPFTTPSHPYNPPPLPLPSHTHIFLPAVSDVRGGLVPRVRSYTALSQLGGGLPRMGSTMGLSLLSPRLSPQPPQPLGQDTGGCLAGGVGLAWVHGKEGTAGKARLPCICGWCRSASARENRRARGLRASSTALERLARQSALQAALEQMFQSKRVMSQGRLKLHCFGSAAAATLQNLSTPRVASSLFPQMLTWISCWMSWRRRCERHPRPSWCAWPPPPPPLHLLPRVAMLLAACRSRSPALCCLQLVRRSSALPPPHLSMCHFATPRWMPPPPKKTTPPPPALPSPISAVSIAPKLPDRPRPPWLHAGAAARWGAAAADAPLRPAPPPCAGGPLCGGGVHRHRGGEGALLGQQSLAGVLLRSTSFPSVLEGAGPLSICFCGCGCVFFGRGGHSR